LSDRWSRYAASWGAFLRSKFVYAKTSSIYSIERLASTGASFLVYVAMGRLFGPGILGEFNYAQTAANLAGPFLALGAEPVVVRELVRQPQNAATILGSGFRILFINSLIVTALPVLFVWVALANARSAVIITSWLVAPFFFNGFLVIDHFFRAKMMARQLVTARVISLLLGLALKLGAIFAGLSVIYVAVGFAAEQIALVLLLMAAYRRLGQRIGHWSSTRETRHLLFRQSLPSMISAVVVQLFFRLNFLMLGALYKEPGGALNEVGQYGMAFQIVQLTNMLPLVLFSAVYPRLVILHAENPTRYRTVLRSLLIWITGLGYALLLGAYFLGPPVLHLVFAAKFDRAAGILVVLCASTVFNFSGAVRAQFINIDGITKYHLFNAGVGLAVLAPASFYLIPLYGGLGAAWAAAMATFVSGVLSSLLLPRTRSFGIDQLCALLLFRVRSETP
jgi:O-antigen/teichoic acid export membrane protein